MRLNQRKAGVLLNYLYEGIRLLTTLVYTPIMLRLLGESEYGLYDLVSSTVAYLNLLSLGFSGAYVRYHSQYYVKDDEDGIARLNGMFIIIFGVMAVLSLVCGSVMTVKAELLFDDGLTATELAKAKVLMGILVISTALTFPNTVFTCFVSAYEQFVFQRLLSVVQSILNPCLVIPLLLLGYDSVAVVLVTAGLTAVTFAVNAFYCFQKLKMRFSFRNLQPALLKEMWGFTFFIFLNQIIDQVNWSVDKFLLERIKKSTAVVAVYAIGGQINSLYYQVSSSVVTVFAPRVNRIVASTDDNTELTAMMIRVGRIQLLILGLILSGFALFGQEFIRLWAGDGFGDAYWVALLLMTPVTVPLIQNLGIDIQRAKNKHRARSIVCSCLAVGNVLLSIVLIPYFGSIGAAAGTAVALLIGNGLFMNWYYHYRIGLNMLTFWKAIIRLLPAGAAAVGFGVLYTTLISTTGWIGLVLGIVVYTVGYALIMWLLGMNRYEKELVLGCLRAFDRRRSKND